MTPQVWFEGGVSNGSLAVLKRYFPLATVRRNGCPRDIQCQGLLMLNNVRIPFLHRCNEAIVGIYEGVAHAPNISL